MDIALTSIPQDEALRYLGCGSGADPATRALAEECSRLLLAAVADKARAQGARTLELGAQYDKQGFYETVGFAPYGEPYLDEGYPHVPMRMAL